MKFCVPDIDKIIAKPEARFFKGYYSKEGKFIKKMIKTQATLPNDKKLLNKVGLKRNEKVLVIAGYYGDWAKALAKAGVIVCYSDVSKNLVNYAKKSLKERNIKEYICSDYSLIPSKALKYDWSFSFEPIGANQGLPIAMLRSLLNKKGGKLVVYPRIVEEEFNRHLKSSRKLTRIIKRLSKTYKTRYEISKRLIIGKAQKGEKLAKKHVIVTIFTNDSARKKAEIDLKVLDLIRKRKLKSSEISKEIIQSLKRIDKLTKVIDKNFVKKVMIK
jgi:protein-L-isoaspartate O-methyltransferase